VIKKYSVASRHTVGFAIIHGDPIDIQLGNAVGASWKKMACGLLLGDLLHQALELRGAGLIDAGHMVQSAQIVNLIRPEIPAMKATFAADGLKTNGFDLLQPA
jgi:hypothetical protein